METVNDIIQINRKAFDLKNLNQIVPLIYNITKDCERRYRVFELQMHYNPHRSAQFEGYIHELYHEWSEKILRLGGIPRGFWYADFKKEDYYFCWAFPEKEILRYHYGEKSCFHSEKRRSISELSQKNTEEKGRVLYPRR